MRARVLCLVVMLAGLTQSTFAQVDRKRAEQYFKEAATMCAREGGRLWGISLCGPIVFADAATGTIAASQPPPDGPRPRTLGFVNAPVEWGGTRWAAYAWQMVPRDDAAARGSLLMHELFHRIQPQLGLMVFGAGDNAHLDTLEGRYWLQLEWRALLRALRNTGPDRAVPVADALGFRAARRARFPEDIEKERTLELREGLASYTGDVAFTASVDEARQFVIGRVLTADQEQSFVMTFAYRSGSAYGLLLDAFSQDWRQGVTAKSDLGELLASASGLRPTTDAVAAARGYDGAGLRAIEEKRDAEQQARVALLRARFVDGPVLVTPRVGSGSVNNTGAVAIPGVGTVVREYRGQGAWGRLEGASGVLMSSDGQTLVVPAPVVVDATTLKGDGWTFTAGPGWIVQPGPRAGSFRVVQQ